MNAADIVALILVTAAVVAAVVWALRSRRKRGGGCGCGCGCGGCTRCSPAKKNPTGATPRPKEGTDGDTRKENR